MMENELLKLLACVTWLFSCCAVFAAGTAVLPLVTDICAVGVATVGPAFGTT